MSICKTTCYLIESYAPSHGNIQRILIAAHGNFQNEIALLQNLTINTANLVSDDKRYVLFRHIRIVCDTFFGLFQSDKFIPLFLALLDERSEGSDFSPRNRIFRS